MDLSPDHSFDLMPGSPGDNRDPLIRYLIGLGCVLVGAAVLGWLLFGPSRSASATDIYYMAGGVVLVLGGILIMLKTALSRRDGS
jgi:uncharacterized protein YjeT (DUF2065 family)